MVIYNTSAIPYATLAYLCISNAIEGQQDGGKKRENKKFLFEAGSGVTYQVLLMLFIVAIISVNTLKVNTGYFFPIERFRSPQKRNDFIGFFIS